MEFSTPLGKKDIPDDPNHYLLVTSQSVKLYAKENENVCLNEWNFDPQNWGGYEAKRCLDCEGKAVRPWVDCRLGKLLIVQWSCAPPRMYTVWNLHTKEEITHVNLYYMYPRDVPIRAWLTKEGVAITAGPKYDHGVSWSYIPYKSRYHWVEPVQTFLGCRVSFMLVDDTGELVVVYDYEDDNIYVYDLTKSPLRGATRGRCSWYPTHVKRLTNTSVELGLQSRHDENKTSVVTMDIGS